MLNSTNTKKALIKSITNLGYNVTDYQYCAFTKCITVTTDKGNFDGNTRSDVLKLVVKYTKPRSIVEAVEFLEMFMSNAHPSFNAASDEMFYNDKSVHQVLNMFK